MKLRVIFSEPPHADIVPVAGEKLVVIKSPYKITQEAIGAEREIKKEDGSEITYEKYCAETAALIAETFSASGLPEHGPYSDISVEGFREPPNFKAVCSVVADTPITYTPKSNITFKDCLFGGALYTAATSKLVRSVRARSDVTFSITLDETASSRLSAHDEARLASLGGVTFFRDKSSVASIRPVMDDSLLGVKSGSLAARLASPTYYYREAIRAVAPSSEGILKRFFSESAQQQSDYTCGPATIKMVAGYYTAMHRHPFCGEPLLHEDIWRKIDTSADEMALAAEVQTTEAVGSDLMEMSTGLSAKGLTVIGDNGWSNEEHTEAELAAHKELLWDKMKDVLKLGVPIILNMRDRTEAGHFEVVIGIESTDEGEHIILAEPGTALVGKPEFERLKKEDFIARWKNMSGEFHGRFMILPPNEATTAAVKSILDGIPHYCMEAEDEDRPAAPAVS
jgi:hypothetical protein